MDPPNINSDKPESEDKKTGTVDNITVPKEPKKKKSIVFDIAEDDNDAILADSGYTFSSGADVVLSQDDEDEDKKFFLSESNGEKGMFPELFNIHRSGKKKSNKIDHTPHKLFVELLELTPTNYGGLEWKEAARWIKYEEDVEGANNRWGKPHISCLHFNALLCLKKSIENGMILLDVNASSLSEIAQIIAKNLVAARLIHEEQEDAINGLLLSRRNHNKEYKPIRKMSAIRRLSSVSPDNQMLLRSRSSSKNFIDIPTKSSSKNMQNDSFLKPEQALDSNFETKEKLIDNSELMRKLPEGIEATSVVVGDTMILSSPVLAFVRLSEGAFMDNVVELPIPLRFFFVFLGPPNSEIEYHEVGRAFSTLMADKYFDKVAYQAKTKDHILKAIKDFCDHTVVLPPLDWKNENLVPIDKIRKKTHHFEKKKRKLHGSDSQTRHGESNQEIQVSVPLAKDEDHVSKDPLKREGKLFNGLITDVKIRYSKYLSDLRDGLSIQVLSTCIFIFFAVLSPTITFGGMYGDFTDKYIGVGETLLVSSINGAIFALFAAQPILIVGSTGPLMIFDVSLLQFCRSMNIDFLAVRAWIGIWILIIGLLVAAFELVFVVKKFTRYIEEIFSTLVCLIFIFGAFEKLAAIYIKNPLYSSGFYTESGNVIIPESVSSVNQSLQTSDEGIVKTNEPNTALLSTFLMLGTFTIAWKLKFFRNSHYLSRPIRRMLGDFGVPIGLFLMVLLDWVIHDTYTDKLSMPKGLQPSNAAVRGWLIDPMGVVSPLPIWAIIVAAPAALLLFVLIFIEENICQLILSKPERCLKKGTGFHLDLVLSCFINTVSGFLGAPFMGPACVRTIAHMSSLTVMSSKVLPGESPTIVGCIEQRVSPLVVSILLGLSVMLYQILNLVPTAVLLGIFLYMGVSATAGIQILERTMLLFMPVKHHPNVHYVTKMKTWKMHLYTGIQLIILVILFVVKQSPASLAIPFILISLLPFRICVLPLIFNNVELIALDGKDQTILDDPDFYEASHDLPNQIEKNHEA